MADKKPAPAPADAAEAKPKSPIVPIIGAAVLSAALVGGVMFFMMPKAAPAPAGAEAAEEPEEPGGDKARYIEVKPAFVVNLPNGPAKYLQVEVQLMVRRESAQKAVEEHLPAIRNRLMLLLQEVADIDVRNREAIEALQAKALSEVNGVLEAETEKKDLVKELLFTSFVTQ